MTHLQGFQAQPMPKIHPFLTAADQSNLSNISETELTCNQVN